MTPVIETDPDKIDAFPYNTNPVVLAPNGLPYGISEIPSSEYVNPLALLAIQNAETTSDRIVGNYFIEVTPIEGLKLKSSINADLNYVTDDNFSDLYYLSGTTSNLNQTNVSKGINKYFSWQWDNTVSYNKKFNDHEVTLLAGSSAYSFRTEDVYAARGGLVITDTDHVYVNQGIDTLGANGGADWSSRASIFGRLSYNFKEKYSLNAVVRRDGSSKFGTENRYGIFPSIGLSWLLSDETFIDLGPINYFKVRGAYGVNGNDKIANFQYTSPILFGPTSYAFRSGNMIGAVPDFANNPSIQWEESKQFNIGFDAGALENRLTLNLDYYVKKTEKLLEQTTVPFITGNDPPVANLGSVKNSGVEIDLNWKNQTGKLWYSIGANATYNVNEVTEVFNPTGVLAKSGDWSNQQINQTVEGQQLAYLYGYKTDGLFQNEADIFSYINSDGDPIQPDAEPGDVRYVDINGDGVIDPDDRTKIGEVFPDWTYGINGSVRYQGFDFSFLMTGVAGNQIFNGSTRYDRIETNKPTSILGRWTGEGTSNSIPRLIEGDTRNTLASDLYVENGDYLKIRNVQVGYTLPKSVLNRISAVTWRVYVSIENLHTFTSYSGVDPEVGARNNDLFNNGIDRGLYPQPRTFRFGTSVTF